MWDLRPTTTKDAAAPPMASTVSETQMDTLLSFRGWPTKHEGWHEGQTIEYVQDDHYYENRAERQTRISELGNRDTAELMKIDALTKRLFKLEQAGQLPDCYTSPEHGWRDDIAKAQSIYVDCPQHVDAFLEIIQIKLLSKEDKRTKLLQIAHGLVADNITVLPQLVWSRLTGERETQDENVEPTKEQMLVRRFGFLFISYRVQFWWWEGVEMLRKLLLTSLIIIFFSARTQMQTDHSLLFAPALHEQLSSAAMITFIFLLMNLYWQPFCSASLNSLSTVTLIAQFATFVSPLPTPT